MSENATRLLLEDAREAMIREVERQAGHLPVEAELASYILPNWKSAREPLDVLQEAATQFTSSPDYRYVATTGFAAARLVREHAEVPPELQQLFSEQLEWLAGRKYELSNGNYASFFSDAPALLGLALGACYAGSEAARAKIILWLRGLLPACSARRNIEEWELCLLAATAHVAGLDAMVPVPHSVSAAGARIALRACKTLPPLNTEESNSDEENALRLLLSVKSAEQPVTQAAFLVAAYDWTCRATSLMMPGRATIADVAGVLRGIQSSLYRWTWDDKPKTRNSQAAQWLVENEYHVQNLLWIILKPLFSDLEDEFYVEPIGQKRPRADIGIPSLRLIIEAKFMRASTTPQNMIDEIAADTGLYLTAGFPYDAIIPFVWDNVPRPQEHDVMRQGMMKMDGIADVVIISRPEFMAAPAASITLSDDDDAAGAASTSHPNSE
jgi:hypothetical protein